MAYAQKLYGSNWRGTVAWRIETKVLKRPVFERVVRPILRGQHKMDRKVV
jgi:hypothetical protein